MATALSNAEFVSQELLSLSVRLASSPTATATIGEGVAFERIRRITGYLVGSLERFNNAKRKEEADRIRHGIRE